MRAMISASVSMLLWNSDIGISSMPSGLFFKDSTMDLISSTLSLVGAKEKVVPTRPSSMFSYLSLLGKLAARSSPNFEKYLLNSFVI